MFWSKKSECLTCGHRFKIEKDRVYLAEEPIGVFAKFTKGATRHDAIDCPACGCQNILNERLPKVTIDTYDPDDDAADADQDEQGDTDDEGGGSE